MFGLSKRERIVGVIASASGRQTVRMQKELRKLYHESQGHVNREQIKFIFDMYFRCVELDVLDHFSEKYPEYIETFNRKLDRWHKETNGVIRAGHLFEVMYSTITGKAANPYYCAQLNKRQEESMIQILQSMKP